METLQAHHNHLIRDIEVMTTFQTIKDQMEILTQTDPSTKEETPNITPPMHLKAETTIPS